MKDHILTEIRRMAAAHGGNAPGQTAFTNETGIAPHQWLGKYWARWGDALAEAGYEPNKWVARLNSNDVLEKYAQACRHHGRIPTNAELDLWRKTEPTIPSVNAIKRHFGKREELVEALRTFARESADYADVLNMLPEPGTGAPSLDTVVSPKTVEGFVYLFKSGDFYKIGRSDDLERRIKEIRVSLPEKLTPVHSIRTDDPPGIEAYWHRRFADRRANGEWFKLSSLDVSAFRKRKFQ